MGALHNSPPGGGGVVVVVPNGGRDRVGTGRVLGSASLALFFLLVLLSVTAQPIFKNEHTAGHTNDDTANQVSNFKSNPKDTVFLRDSSHKSFNTERTGEPPKTNFTPLSENIDGFPNDDYPILQDPIPFRTSQASNFITHISDLAGLSRNYTSTLSGQASPTTSMPSTLMEHLKHFTSQMHKYYNRLWNHLSAFASSSHQNQLSPTMPRPMFGGPINGVFDYIIVGAGAAGSPLARTLAEAGKLVLLIERGYNRTRETLDIYGAGYGIRNTDVSQLFITKQGIRTNVATVMGGGTAINMGVYIEERDEYFNKLNTYPNVHWDMDVVRESYDWIRPQVASPMPFINPYGEALKEGLVNRGMDPNSGYKPGGDPNVTPSDTLLTNKVWQGMSIFNSSDGFHRVASNELLGNSNDPAHAFPPTLVILPRHAVQTVQFHGHSDRPKAVCVTYRQTLQEDVENLNSKSGTSRKTIPLWKSWLKKIFGRFSFEGDDLMRVADLEQACVRPGGEIILSAGAVLTPAILYKSGVGPAAQVKELGLDLVHEIPLLGQSFSDRALVPVGMFRKGPDSRTRICQGLGLKLEGPKCEEYSIGDQTYYCSLLPNEELGGEHLGENIIYSTRFIFPPEIRNEALMDYFFNVLIACSEGKYPYNSKALAGACILVDPAIRCFRRVVAAFYFTAEPKSRGTIKMTRAGEIIVDPNYMKEDTDLFDAVRGVAGLIQTLNSDVYRGIMEEKGSESCPLTILNGLLDILMQISADLRPFIDDNRSKFQKIEKHIKDLIPPPLRNPRYSRDRQITPQQATEAAMMRHELLQVLPVENRAEEKLTQNGRLRSELETLFEGDHDTDVDNGANVKEQEERFERLVGLFRSIEGEGASGEVQKEGKGWSGKAMPSDGVQHRSPDQWAASYPPTLPDPKRPEDVAKFVLTYMTSVWHFAGSAPMGSVVDNEFRVNGIDGLSIVDASVLNQVTRMNPTATLLMLGRYAGLKKLKMQ